VLNGFCLAQHKVQLRIPPQITEKNSRGPKTLRSLFFKISFVVISFQAVLGFFYPNTLFAFILTGPIVLVGMHNAF
jgi:hypothetical protein